MVVNLREKKTDDETEEKHDDDPDDDTSIGDDNADDNDGQKKKIVRKRPSAGPKVKKVTKKDEKNNDTESLKYAGTGYHRPRYYKGSTIYTDLKKMSWRLKLNPGDLHEKYFSFKTEPKKIWASLKKMAIEHNAK